jgi:heavy metal sensor kinase
MPLLASRTGFLRGLRFRITLTNAVFLIGLLVAMGFFFRGVLSLILDAQIRDVLNEEWYAAKSYLVIHRNKPVWRFDHTDQEETFIVERMRRVFLLADKDGRIIDYSVIYEDLGLNPAEDIRKAVLAKDPFWEVRVSSEGEPYQIRGGTFVDDDNQKFFVAIGRSLAGNERTLAAFTRDYYMVLPWLILAGSLLGWFVAGSTLRPVKEFSKTAEAITGQNLSLRLPLRGSGDELDVLTVTFNRMMERLERSFEMTKRFSTDVSHELRTPLTAIRGQLEVALFTAKTQEQYREAIITALEDVERLGHTIRAMLLLSQAESGQLTLQQAPLDLCSVVEDLVEQYQIPAEDAELRLECETAVPAMVDADRIQMERLVSNLLSNALKYTPKGGHIQARVRGEEGHVILEVQDTGAGIPPEYLPHIFDRFYRVPGSSKEKQGLGLGLSFVAWIVQAHRGTITVDSRMGEGTTFKIRFPASAPVEAAPAEVGSPVATS